MKIKLGILILFLFIFHNGICEVDEECVVFLPKSSIKHSVIPELLDELHFSLSCSQLNIVNKPVATIFNEDNVKKWGGDHVVNPELVPGVLFMNRSFDDTEADLRDLAPTILKALGVPKGDAMEGKDLIG